MSKFSREEITADITQRVTNKIRPGAIVLFHNAAKHTPESLAGSMDPYRNIQSTQEWKLVSA